MCVYTYIICMYIIHIYIYIYTCYVCVYVCMYACMHAWMYVCVCMYACMCMYVEGSRTAERLAVSQPQQYCEVQSARVGA